jgi:hypothetical protein
LFFFVGGARERRGRLYSDALAWRAA